VRIVVSLTTIPGREALLERAIASLRRQSHRPDAIFLWLPVERFGADQARTRFAGVEVRSGRDLGPAMKILPLLPVETGSDTLIIPVDDDIEYPPELIDKLARASVVFPDRAIGFTGWNAMKSADKTEQKTEVFHLNEDVACAAMFQPVHVLEGYRGVAYRRGFFEADIFKHLAALDAFRFHDDILLSGYLASRGIARSVRWFGSSPSPPEGYWKLHGQDIGLHTGPNWFEQGMACLDYWSRRVPGIFQPIETLTKAERLQLGADDCPRDGFLHHGQPGAGSTADVAHDLSNIPWPWSDECFHEILALDLFEDLSIPHPDWLKECRRILKPGGILKVRLSPKIASKQFQLHVNPDGIDFGESDANKAWEIDHGFRPYWEYERDKLVGTLLKLNE
jgi:hypothetical protein